MQKLNTQSSLHEDIIVMILSRLPVKSIFRFRCVSKSWRTLLSSKHFIISHLQISIKNTNFSNNSIILVNTVPDSSVSTLKFCPLDTLLLYKAFNYPPTFDYTFPSLGRAFSSILLIGCCNGICCAIVTGKEERCFFLWNPSTRQSTMKFPKMKRFTYNSLYGFGFDQSSNGYKAFVGIKTPVQIDTIAYLYSFKTNCQRKVDFPIKGLGDAFVDREGAFANRKLHWLMIHDYDNDVNNLELDIVCFDLETEAYGGVVEKPFYLNKRFYPSIGVLAGCLCVVCGISEYVHEIWVLKKYGVKEYWDKVMILPFYLNWRRVGPKPLCITPEGVIMFISEKSFYIYDPEKGGDPQCINRALFSQFSVCTQSLVWPFCDGEEENQKQWCGRFVGVNFTESCTVTIQESSNRLGQNDTGPSAGSPFQPRCSKCQRRSPTWMKNYAH